MLARSAEWLRQNSAAINAINVFPVPDGDTGSNMSATLDAAAEAARGAGGDASDVLRAAAAGALLGARGNSGVILSQILSGLAQGAGPIQSFDAEGLSAGLLRAESTAREAVSEPKAGTILTVLTDAAGACARSATDGASLSDALAAAVTAARESVDRTPELLPILKEAGVVDSGGLGLAVILEGFLLYTRGAELPAPMPAVPAYPQERIGRPASGGLGYCTEFIIEGDSLEQDTLREQLQQLGDSVLVVGGPQIIRVHLHTADPGAALSSGVRLGRLTRIKVDNIDAQHQALLEQRQSATAQPAVSLVAVALGHGFEDLLREYGAIVVSGGQSFNPSTQEILSALERAAGESAFVLPNNRNVTAAAKQAALLSSKDVRVLSTASVPEGISALLAFNPERSVGENEETMQEAAALVKTVEVTRAARDVNLNGITARTSQPIALMEDKVLASAETPEEAAAAAVVAILGEAETVTIYFGEPASSESAQEVADAIGESNLGISIEIVDGGQPYYDYIISVE